MSPFVDSAWQDVRYGARLLRLNPAFTLIAVASLALGIGANTAIFQLLDAVRLRMLPVVHPEQLAELKIAENEHCCSGKFSSRWSNFTYAQWKQIQEHQRAFSGLFAWGDHRFDLTTGGEVRFAEGLWVSGDFFRILGVQPYAGRLTSIADDKIGCGSPGVVLSYAFWQHEFGGDPQALGRMISLDGHRLPIAGITPPAFFGIEVGRRFDVIVPMCAEPLIDGEQAHMPKLDDWWIAIMGRLKPGWTVERAAAQAAAMSPAVFEPTVPPRYRADMVKYYVKYKLTADSASAGVSDLRKAYFQPLLILLGIAALVLLIACANLANLMLARATAREREMAVRLAVGASRVRLIRQLLAESCILAFAGAAIGAVLAQFLTHYLVAFLATGDNPLFLELRPNWHMFGFTAAVSIATCILFALTPALKATRTAPIVAMRASGRGLTADRERFGLRRILVVSQVSLSLVLLITSLLFVRSLRNLWTTDAGLNDHGLLIASVDASRLNYGPPRRGVLYRDVLKRVQATPGVQSAATASVVPLSGDGWNDSIEVIGQPTPSGRSPWFDRVSAGYFRTMVTPLVAGRDFDEHDSPSSPLVAVVNEEFCRKYLSGANPIGKQIRKLVGPGESPDVFKIVGLVRNSKYQNLRDKFEPIIFVAATQDKEPWFGTNFLVRSSTAPGPLTAEIKQILMNESPGVSVQFQNLETQVRDSLLRERLMASLSSFFGFLAATLAAVGLYGVLSYMVARRRNEIGIRMALGANRSNVVFLIVQEAGLLIALGLVIGTALAILATRAASSLLFGLKPYDPITILLAILLLSAVALTAAFLPAIRASRLQPMTALRDE